LAVSGASASQPDEEPDAELEQAETGSEAEAEAPETAKVGEPE